MRRELRFGVVTCFEDYDGREAKTDDGIPADYYISAHMGELGVYDMNAECSSTDAGERN